MRARGGTVVQDKRIRTWNFLWWENGRRHSKRIGTKAEYPTKTAAWRAAKLLRDAVEQRVKQPTAPTVKALVEAYRQEKMPQRYSTRRSYEVWLRLYILPRWGSCPITEVQARDTELWLASLDLAPRSKTGIRMMLRLLWDFAQWRGDVPVQRNPVELVRVRNATRRVRQPRSLTPAEFAEFVEHLREPFRTIALLSVTCGLRISECLALRWSDVDWLEGKLSIQRAIVRQHLDAAKTRYSEGKLPIDRRILDVLKMWKAVTEFSGADDWLFASPAQIGRLPWSADAVNDAYLKAGVGGGIGPVSTHCLRHTFRSWLDAAGARVSVQKQLMRHSSITTTMDTYGRIVTDEMTEASGKVASLALNGLGADCKRL